MYISIFKKFKIMTFLMVVFVITVTNTAFAGADSDISQLLKKFQDSDNPIDSSIINSNINILDNNTNTLDNALNIIYSEPAVSDNYDKIGPLFSKSNISGIKIFVDGQLIEFSKYDNVNPAIIENRVYVPLRAIVEKLGATVDWDETTGSITIKLFDKTIGLVVDSEYASVNGQQVIMDARPRIIDGRTLVPIRFISESLSMTVEWHPYDETLNVVAIY